MVGRDYEHKGIAKDGAKMVQAVANANVPKITLIMGKSYGAGNYAMAGRSMSSHFLFSWPTARVAVMGGEQASIVLSTVKSTGKVSLVEQFEQESTAYYATSRLWDDGIIDPAESRNVLGFCLSVVAYAPKQSPQYGIFRM
jgi:3-methylcrotonyl-CoA carboxylase beta subunit